MPPGSIECPLVNVFGANLKGQSPCRVTPPERVGQLGSKMVAAPNRKRAAAAKPRSWRVTTIRSRGEHLGTVEAPDRERAEAVAVKAFDLNQDQPGG
jgi:hypothetical protein